MALVCNNPAAAEKVLDDLPISPNPESEQRLLTMSGKSKMSREELLDSSKWRHASTLIKEFAENYVG
jgi:beta-N-acetylhexosaminidase